MPTPDEFYDEATELRDAGDVVGAVAKLDLAIADDPDHVISHGMLAKLHADQFTQDQDPERAEKAVFHAKRVVELEPDDAFSYTALSVVYQRVGMIPEAEEAKAISQRVKFGLE